MSQPHNCIGSPCLICHPTQRIADAGEAFPLAAPEIICCCGRRYTEHQVSAGPVFCPGFLPRPFAAEGSDAPHHVCDHGFAARTCGLCERDGMLRRGR